MTGESGARGQDRNGASVLTRAPTAGTRRYRALRGLATGAAEQLDRRFGWHRLPVGLGIFTLWGLRERLRERNLIAAPPAGPLGSSPRTGPPHRTVDGSGNDPAHPQMGAVGAAFGRNTLPLGDPAMRDTPPARRVSEQLLDRREFLPATSLNLLAAAWIQFEVHDWFDHRLDTDAPPRGPDADGVSMPPPFQRAAGTDTAPVFASTQTHWWDASQLYGASAEIAQSIADPRDLAKLRVGDDLLRHIESRAPGATAAPAPNLWVGLALLHDLFAREHNAICDALRANHPRWPAERIYEIARLTNAALMAKIHTIEWTPAIIAHPTTVHSLRATWWGLLGERVRRGLGRVGGDVLSGVPGAAVDHDGVPYALTEEFVAVYRMHPLIPDDVAFYRAADGTARPEGHLPFSELAAVPGDAGRPRAWLREIGAADALYSLARAHPGQLSLHNHPAFLQRLRTHDGRVIDLGAVDVDRSRECALGRYNDVRRQLRLSPATTFLELAGGDRELAGEIERVYGDVERVDLLIGLLAEPKPRGFAFGDTTFRVFLLMAARRLRSDRFFGEDYTAEVYTGTGMRWIEETTMADVLRRHVPELEPPLRGVANVFAPWPRTPRLAVTTDADRAASTAALPSVR